MATELAVIIPQQRVTVTELEAMRDVVRNVIAPKSTDDELTFFFKVCESVQLDPFKRQIYLIPRWDSRAGKEVHQPQSAIDGLRAIAQRTGKYRGQIGPYWTGRDKQDDDGKPLWTDCWLDPNNPPAAAKIAVLHADFDEPLWAVAVWEAYVQTDRQGKLTGQWPKSGYNQLAKCAEALALRRAFPEETAGLVTVDEVASEYEEGQAAQAQPPEPVRIEAGAALEPDVDANADRTDTVEAVDAATEPWQGYDGENVRLIGAKLDAAEDAALVARVHGYESANKKRNGVVLKAEYRLREISETADEGSPPAPAAGSGTDTPAVEAQTPPPAPFPPQPAPALAPEPEPELAEESPGERLQRACQITYERWPDQPGWEPTKVLAQAAGLFDHAIATFDDMTVEEIDSIWSAIPEEIQKEVMGHGTT